MPLARRGDSSTHRSVFILENIFLVILLAKHVKFPFVEVLVRNGALFHPFFCHNVFGEARILVEQSEGM